MNDSATGESTPGNGPAHDPYAALRHRNFRLYLIGSVIANIGLQMQSVAVGWEIWKRTDSPRALALIGLVQVLPVVLLSIASGHVADRFPRQLIIASSMLLAMLGSIGLALGAWLRAPLEVLYGCLLLIAVARAFHQPAKAALLPQIVGRDLFANAVGWGTSGFQLSSVIGPAIGGVLIGWTKTTNVVFVIAACSTLVYALMMLQVRDVAHVRSTEAVTARTLVAGFTFVWRSPLILAALTLDLFAVLLGGATALLPVYASQILNVGATGLGWLEAAPALGAVTMAVVLAHRPPLQHAGRALVWAVAGFGLATIEFGLSRTFWWSLSMLFITGALDHVSVVVRHTLVQMGTPDAMRGRVSAVNSMFIGTSNELGGFESGMVADAFGPTASVVAGGIGTMLVVGLVALVCPQLRRYGSLESSELSDGEAAPRALQHPAVAGAPPASEVSVERDVERQA